jgi:hypothetical protein
MSWNGKKQEIIAELEHHKIDICGLSETKKKGKGPSRHANYILIYSGKDKHLRASSGVGILLHEKYEDSIENIEYVNHRILKIALKIENTLTNIISVYAPDITKPLEEIEEFYTQLEHIISEVPVSEKLIMLGDFNARIGNTIIPGIKQRFNESALNRNGEMLIDVCSRNEMRICNTFFPHKLQHKYTFENSRGDKSMIDHIVTNRKILPTSIKDVRVLSSANIGSDHHLVLCKILLKHPKGRHKEPKYVTKINVKAIENDSTRGLYMNRLTNKISQNEITEQDTVEDAWKKIKLNIKDAAKEALGESKVNINGRPNLKPWYEESVKTLAKEKRVSYLIYRSNPTPEEYRKYKTVRNRVNREIDKIKKDYWQKFTTDIERDLSGAQRKIWNMLRKQKKPVTEYIQTNKITIEEWENYFVNLFGNNTQRTAAVEEGERSEVVLTSTEVKMAIKKLKNRKSPGIDEIPNELIKYGGVKIMEEIRKLFNKILSQDIVPNEWKMSITIPIFKKGDKTNPENYRGISLLCAIQKLFTSILKRKLEQIIENNDEQQGFRRNRSTTDAVFVLTQIKEKSLEYNEPAFMCFVDLTKAFDRVLLEDVTAILSEKGTPSPIIKSIQNLNTNNLMRIKVGNELSKEIPAAIGIRQGDSLSPFLFNIIMDKIIEDIKALQLGYTMGNNHIGILCYADDAVLLADSESDLQKLLQQFHTSSQLFNMKISINKTKSMVTSRQPVQCNLVIDNDTIEQVTRFKYLGVEVSSCSDLYEEVKSQANKASAVAGCLKATVWRNKDMLKESKVKIYKTCIRPILTYGIESRADTVRTKSLLRTTEMKTLRPIAGTTLRDRVRNSDIRRTCDVQDVGR